MKAPAKLLAAGLLLGLPALIAAQAVIVRRGEFLPADPGFGVDATVTPTGDGDRSAQPVRLAVLGDSTARGVGVEDVEDSLAHQVAQRVADELGMPVRVDGAAVTGAETAEVTSDQLDELSPDVEVVLVVIGSNDATAATPPWTFARQTRELAGRARTQADAPVVVAGIPRFATTPVLPQPLRTVVDGYGQLLARLQRDAVQDSDATFVDIASNASPRFAGRPEAYSSDGFHPSSVGYGFWADAIAPAVAKAVHR